MITRTKYYCPFSGQCIKECDLSLQSELGTCVQASIAAQQACHLPCFLMMGKSKKSITTIWRMHISFFLCLLQLLCNELTKKETSFSSVGSQTGLSLKK
jgi:hypothetical protein